jgi:hypothetical protein
MGNARNDLMKVYPFSVFAEQMAGIVKNESGYAVYLSATKKKISTLVRGGFRFLIFPLSHCISGPLFHRGLDA